VLLPVFFWFFLAFPSLALPQSHIPAPQCEGVGEHSTEGSCRGSGDGDNEAQLKG